MSEKNRVYALYRVSTLGQVEKDDIPMQRQCCREFTDKMGWTIEKEYAEKGISGFKVSAKDRDAIQEIQRDAAEGRFDILLVYMFDRLGRREDETPFVVEWFVKNDVEVWSTVEGQQRFDSHTDKLLNYIRYWQASGESIKTSIRTKTRLGQIVQEGKFRGGACPFGYSLVKQGRMGKKGRECYDIILNEEEATVVKKMFELTIERGYGARLISSELASQGIYDRKGQPFHYATIRGILHNILYVGILRSSDTRSEIFPELQIVSQEDYDRVQEIMAVRSQKHVDQVNAPRRVHGQALLSGNIYCGHCGGRMFASTTLRSKVYIDVPERIPIYKCYNRTKGPSHCENATAFRADRVDSVIKELLHSIFDKTGKSIEKTLVDTRLGSEISTLEFQLKKTQRRQREHSEELDSLDAQMADTLSGRGVFTPQQLKRRMDKVQEELTAATRSIFELENQLKDAETLTQNVAREAKNLMKWAEVFDDAESEVQKMIVAQMIEQVTVRRGYEVDIKMNISMAQFINGF